MTAFIVDVSRHQVERSNPLNLPRARDAGMNVANVQLDRGKQDDVLPPWALGYVTVARALGMGVSTYRWLDNRLPGDVSAKRAYERMKVLGGPDGMAHAIDCEDNATQDILRAYVDTMQGLLGRRIAIYSGAWWMKPRGWRIRDMSPYLWAAPTAGYQVDYPGDASPMWSVSYGGHTALDVMQYAVKPLPLTGDCSLSAIRDPAVWAALTGGKPMTYADPALVTVRNYLINVIGLPGDAVGIVGDVSHQSSGGYHVGNDVLANIGKLTSDYSKRESSRDRPGSNAAMALDIGGLNGVDLAALTDWLIAQCKAGAPDTADIREVIGRDSPSGGIQHWDRLRTQTGLPAGHDTHTHLSYHRDSEGRSKLALFKRYFEGEPAPPAPPATAQKQEEDTMVIVMAFAAAAGSQPARWGIGVVSGGAKMWFEAGNQNAANAYALRHGVGGNASVMSQTEYDTEKAKFV